MVEEIPPEDNVSRFVDSPDKWDAPEGDFIEQNLWRFTQPDQVESLVWRKYAPGIDDVHQLGCAMQLSKRESGKASFTYMGAITSGVQVIRSISTNEGDSFEVVHYPDEGPHHAHVHLCLAPDRENWRQRKTNLKEMLHLAFSPIEGHSCTE